MNKDASLALKLFGGVSGFLILLILIFGSIYTVQAGYRGILLTFGKPDSVAKTEGIGFKIPIAQKVVKMAVQTQKYEADASAASKDMQVVSTKIAVNYHIVSERVPEIYTELSLAYQDRLIQPAVQEVVKASTAQFTAEELITRRPEVKDKIKELYENLFRHFQTNKDKQKISFTEFIGKDKDERIIAFLPLLHLETQKKIWLEQEKHFEEIYLWLKKTYLKHHPEPFAELKQELAEELTDEQKQRAEETESNPFETL